MSHETVFASKGELHDKAFDSETVRSHYFKNVPNGLTVSRLTEKKIQTIRKFQISSCLVADAVTTVFHTDTENKDL